MLFCFICFSRRIKVFYKHYSFSMRKIYLIITSVTLLAACDKEIAKNKIAADNSSAQKAGLTTTAVTTTEATYFDSVFTRYGGGWTGGDAAVSYKLPDGRVLWLFGDSFLDTVYPNRTRPRVSFIHNTMVTTDAVGGNFKTYYGGTQQSPLPYFKTTSKQYYWPAMAFMDEAKTKVYVFMDKVKTLTGGTGGFEVTGVDVGILNYPDLTIQKIVKFSTGYVINWAGASLEDEDGYIYIYGPESTTYNKYIHVARTPKNNPLSSVTYYNGTNWVGDSSKSVRLQDGVSESFSVFKNEGKYYLLSQGNLLSKDIYLWDMQSPSGPFTNKRFVFTTPAKIGTTNIVTYNATAHPEFNQNNQLLVGYCTNSLKSAGLYNNADSYRPYFVWASNWQ